MSDDAALLKAVLAPKDPPLIEQDINLIVPESIPITHESHLDQVLQADTAIANAVLHNICQIWSAVNTLGAACKLAETTMNLLAQRRALLLKPLGAPAATQKRALTLPLD